MTTAVERFLKYVSYDTQSDEAYDTCPSTEKQLLLANELKRELEEMGASDVRMSEYGYLFARIPDNTGSTSAHDASGVGQKATIPALGFISHMDTAPSLTGTNVKPRIVQAYDGKDIVLNAEKQIVMKVSEFPFLADLKGQDLIVTDGTTLLGADDKAGVAEIMTAAQQLLAMGGRHATLKIGFTPDEEIGRGADRFDVKGFGADFAYTADGGPVGEIEYENFNAAGAKVVVHGLNIHPGSAKGKMVNSQLIAMEFQSLLPVGQRPELTEGYEGFFHLLGMKGEVERSELHYIIRDHDMEKFEEKKAVMTAAADFINRKYGAGTLELTLKDSYYNMKKCIEPCMYVVERAKKAMAAAGMNPVEVPIRGGTDGARLSYEGLPCPNLCTGGENYHGRFEFIPTEDMEKCVRMLVEILTA